AGGDHLVVEARRRRRLGHDRHVLAAGERVDADDVVLPVAGEVARHRHVPERRVDLRRRQHRRGGVDEEAGRRRAAVEEQLAVEVVGRVLGRALLALARVVGVPVGVQVVADGPRG
ncbi:MAG: hypothetical protein ACK56F_18015, partial [bacterium]